MKKLKTRLWKIFTLMSTKQQKYSDKEITFISETFEEPIYIYTFSLRMVIMKNVSFLVFLFNNQLKFLISKIKHNK